jgi:hypothetical protein
MMINGFTTPSPHPLSGGCISGAVEMNNTCKAAEIFGANESYSVGRVVERELSVLNEGKEKWAFETQSAANALNWRASCSLI